MLADDDGFVNSPKAIMRQSGGTDDDMKLLIAKKFILPFESGVIVITHWRLNNYLRSDRYTQTKYLEEKAELIVEANGAYKKAENAVKLPEPKKEVKRGPLLEREPKNDIEKVEKEYLQNYQKLYKNGVVKSDQPVINWNQSRRLTKDCIAKYGLDTVVLAVKKSVSNKFCIEKGYVLTTILSAGVLAGLINGGEKKEVVNEQFRTEEIEF